LKKIISFVAARFARRYLGLHLTIGFLVAVIALWIFAALTQQIIRAETLTRFDLDVHNWIRGEATVTGYAVFGAISELGSPLVIGIFALLGAVEFWRLKRHLTLLAWIGTFVGGGLLDWVLKIVVHRPRPEFASDYLVHNTFSFPSGHSMMSMVCYGMVTYGLVVLRLTAWWSRALAIVIAAGVIIAVGTSRMYLGVHFFSDVIAGFTAGILWLAACISGLEVARRKQLLAQAHPEITKVTNV
jgi:membrane-associated phospholipid phosphatase